MIATAVIAGGCGTKVTTKRHRVDNPEKWHEDQIGDGERVTLRVAGDAPFEEVVARYLDYGADMSAAYVSDLAVALYLSGQRCVATLIPPQEERMVRAQCRMWRITETRCGGWSGSSATWGHNGSSFPVVQGRCDKTSSSWTEERDVPATVEKLEPLPADDALLSMIEDRLKAGGGACASVAEDGDEGTQMNEISAAFYAHRGERLSGRVARERVAQPPRCGPHDPWRLVTPASLEPPPRRVAEVSVSDAQAMNEADAVLPTWTGEEAVVETSDGQTVTVTPRR